MGNKRRTGLLVVLAAVLVVVSLVLPSAQQRPPTFQARVVLVPIDVRVVDAEGRPVSGLTADDFVLTENGVRQKISHFDAYTLQPDPDSVAGPTLRQRTATLPTTITPQKHRVFLVVLGRGRQNEPSKGPEALARFIRQRLLPQDRVAVLAWWNRATDFTTDHEKVAQVMDRFKAAHEAIEAQASQRLRDLGVTDGDPDSKMSAQQMMSWVFAGTTSKTVTPATEAKAMARQENKGLSGYVTDEMGRNTYNQQGSEPAQARRANGPVSADSMTYQDFQMLFVPFDRYVEESARNTSDLSAVLTGIDYLRRIEGEKHLIFMAEKPLYLGRVENDLSIAAMASDARIALDVVQTGGIPGPLPAATFAEGFERTADKEGPTPSQMLAMATLRNLSELTGGISSLMDYADRATSRIDQASRSGYLLGYYPADSNWNGAFRRIDIKVNRNDSTVLFRHGYYAKDTFAPIDQRAFFAFNRIAGAAATPVDNRSIRITVESATSARNENGSLEASVDMRIDLSALTFRLQGDREIAALDIAVFCGDSKDNLVGELWQKADLALKPDTYQRMLRDGLRRSVRIPLKSPAANVKVVVYQYAEDRIGSATAKTRVGK